MPSLDITNALREFPLVGFSFAQSRDGRYLLKYCGRVDQSALSRALKEQLEIDGEVVLVEDWSGKPQQFKGPHTLLYQAETHPL